MDDVVDSRLVGHSLQCVYDVLNGRVLLADVQAIYLTRITRERLDRSDMLTRMRLAGIRRPNYLEDAEWRGSFIYKMLNEGETDLNIQPLSTARTPADHALLKLYDEVADMWDKKVILPRPEAFGPVGAAYWTRNGEAVTMPWGDERVPTTPALI